MKLVRELSDIANEIIESGWEITPFEALHLAAKIQQNRILSDAFMVNSDKYPGALEAIAMGLGIESNGRGAVTSGH